MTTTRKKTIKPAWVVALREIATNDWNPMGRAGGIQSSIGLALVDRGLCERKGARMPLTITGIALLASLDAGGAPVWLVPIRSLLRGDGGGAERDVARVFPGATAEEAHAKARAWCDGEGDCEVGAVEDVDGPLDVPAVSP